MSERSYDMDKMLDRLDALEARERLTVQDTLKAINGLDQRLNLHEDAITRLERAERAAFNGAGLPPEQLEKAVYRIANEAVSKRTGGLEVQADLSARLDALEAVCAKLKHLRIAKSVITPDGLGGLNIRPGTEAFDQAIAIGLGISQDELKAARADCAKHIPGSDAPENSLTPGRTRTKYMSDSLPWLADECNNLQVNYDWLWREAEEIRRERDGWRDEANEREAIMADMGKRNEELRAEVQTLRNLLATYDNPENDMTPFQHPAYTRGYDAGTAVAVKMREERDELLAGFCAMWDTLDWMHACGDAGRSVWDRLDRLRPLAKRPQPMVHSSCKEALATEPVTASPAVTKEPQTSDNSNPTT